MPNNDYSRAEYLRALLTQKETTQRNGSPLLNPSIGEAAALDTSFQGVSPLNNPTERNAWQRMVDTGNDFQLDMVNGVVQFAKGIVDARVWLIGSIGSLFGADDQWAKDFMASDWSKGADVINRLFPSSAIMTGDFFNPNSGYWDFTSDEYTNKTRNGSFISEIPNQDVQNVIHSVGQGIGNVLPNIAIGNFMGAAGATQNAIKFAGLGTAFAQGFGSGASEAIKEGASLGQAGATGLLSGGVEAATEAFVGKGIGALTGAGEHILGQSLGKQAAKGTAKEVISSMFEEGMEEVVSEILSPYTKAPYKGIEQANRTVWGIGSPEWFNMIKDAGVSFLGGAVGGGLGSGVQVGIYGKKGSALINTVNQMGEISEKQQALLKEGGDHVQELATLDEQMDTLKGKLTQQLNDFSKLKNSKKKSERSTYKRVIELFKDPVAAKTKVYGEMSEDQQLEMAEKSLRARVDEDAYQNFVEYVNDVLEQNGSDTRIFFDDDEDFEKTLSSKKARVAILQLKDGTSKGFYDPQSKQVFISREYRAEVGALIRHELVSHAIFDNNKEIRSRVLEAIKSDEKASKEFNQSREWAENRYKGEEKIESEALAHFMESHLDGDRLMEILGDSRAARSNTLTLLQRIKKRLQNAKKAIDNKIFKHLDEAIKTLKEDRQKIAFSKSIVGKYVFGENHTIEVRATKSHDGKVVGYKVLQDGKEINEYNGSEREWVDEREKPVNPKSFSLKGKTLKETESLIERYLKEMGAKRPEKTFRQPSNRVGENKDFSTKEDLIDYLKKEGVKVGDKLQKKYKGNGYVYTVDKENLLVKKVYDSSAVPEVVTVENAPTEQELRNADQSESTFRKVTYKDGSVGIEHTGFTRDLGIKAKNGSKYYYLNSDKQPIDVVLKSGKSNSPVTFNSIEEMNKWLSDNGFDKYQYTDRKGNKQQLLRFKEKNVEYVIHPKKLSIDVITYDWEVREHNERTGKDNIRRFKNEGEVEAYLKSYTTTTKNRNDLIKVKFIIKNDTDIYTKKDGVTYKHHLTKTKSNGYKVSTFNRNTGEKIETKSFKNYNETRRYFEQAPEATNNIEDLMEKKPAKVKSKKENKLASLTEKKRGLNKKINSLKEKTDLTEQEKTELKEAKIERNKVKKEIKELKGEKVAPKETPVKVEAPIIKEVKEVVKLINKPTTEDYKNYARAHKDTFITAKSSQEIGNLISAFVIASAQEKGIHLSVKQFNDIGERVFKDYNTLDKSELTVKLESTVRDWLKTEIKYEDGVNTTIGEILKADLDEKTTDKFVRSMAKDIQTMLEARSEETQMKKLKNFFRGKIASILERVSYYRNAAVAIVKTQQDVVRLKDKLDSTPSLANLREQTGFSELQLQVIKNTFSGRIEASKSFKGFSPNTINKIMGNIDWYSTENLAELFPFYEPNGQVLQDIKELKAQLPLKGQVSLENTIRFHNIVKEICHLSRGIMDAAKASNIKAHKSQFVEWEIVKSSFWVNDKNHLANILSKAFRETSSPASTFASRFGSNSKIYKVLYTDVVEANSAHLTKMVNFKNELLKIAQKYDVFNVKDIKKFSDYQKVQEKMEKVLRREFNVTVHQTNNNETKTVPMSLGMILDVYLHSQTTQGYNTLMNGGYSYKYKNKSYTLRYWSEDDIAAIEKIVADNNLKEFADETLKTLYNKQFTEYKEKADVKWFGVKNIKSNDVYYPNNKAVEAITGIDANNIDFHNTNPAQWGSNKINRNDTWIALNGMDFETRFDNYVHSLTVYGEMYEACTNFDAIMKYMLKDGDSDNYIRGFKQLVTYYADQIAGRPVNKTGVGSGRLYSNVVSATLGGNISVVMKQTASLPTIMNEVSLASFIKGLSGVTNVAKYGDIKSQIAEVSGLLALRWGKGEVLKASTLADTINGFAKFFGKGMEFVDSAVIVTVGYRSAQFEAQALYGSEIGSEENTEQAIKILERIVAKTQSNSINLEMSMARAGAAGVFQKVLSVFSSDLQNKISYINQLFTEKHFAELRNVGADKYLAKIETKISEQQELVDDLKGDPNRAKAYDEARSKLEDLKETRKEIDEAKERNNEIIDDKKRTAKQAKLLVSLALSGAMIVAIEQLVKRILGRKGWDEEEDGAELAKAFILEGTIFNLPYVQQIFNAIDYDKDIGAFDLTLLNEGIGAASQFAKALESGDSAQYQKLLVPVLRIFGDMSGIPVYNIYNLLIGGVKTFDYEQGTKWDAFVRGYSSSYINGAFRSAVNNNGDRTANSLLSLNMSMYKAGKANDNVINEIRALYSEGYQDVMPKNYMTSYTDETGTKVQLSDTQIGLFKTTYQGANTAVSELLKVSDYRNATREEKSKMINSVYNSYYVAAKAKALGKVDGLSKIGKLIYYSNGNISISKFVAPLNKISTIEANGTKTKKELVVSYINKLHGLSKQEKVLLMYLCGYKVSGDNLRMLKQYLSSRGITKKDLPQMLPQE